MKKIIKIFSWWVLSLLYKEFSKDDHHYGTAQLLKLAWKQKILSRNRHVPWPVHPTSFVKGVSKIQRGTKYPGSAPGVYIDGRNGLIIEENVWIGPGVSIITMNHDLHNYSNYVDENPVKIGKNSLLGSSCIILPGVQLGRHTVVAAGSVVTKSFPKGNQVLGGNPAKIIKEIHDYGSMQQA